MRKISGLMLALVTLALAACGGDKSFVGGSSSTSSGSVSSGGSATVASLTLVSNTSSIPSDGSASATITAYVRDAQNALIANIPVSFTATSGGITPASADSDAGGTATATLITAGEPTLRTITVTATAGGISATTDVMVVSTASSTSVQMGNGTGANFVAGVIGASSNHLVAGGSTTLSVYLVQSDGTLYTTAASVIFNSTCVANNTATITPSSTATTSTGIATVTYTAKGCSGSDIVTATATVGSNALSASVSIQVDPAAVGSITFTSATPTNIALKGTGDAGHPESSTVIFTVADASGGAVSGATVTFALNSSVGGVSITPVSATSDANGKVQTVVSAGTVATSVRVTATVTSVTPNISTQSSQLTVTTGIPTADSFSLAVGCHNIEGWDIDGTTTSVTARLGDRFQNPVPDGTTVTFSAEGGNILSQCQTTTNSTEGGVCSVNFRSSNPRPSDGRVSLLASAIGEESFVDANGNGVYDSGETFTDLGEPFRDDDESGVYKAGDYFVDFDNNGAYSYGNGLFDGLLCNAGATCGNKSLAIGSENLIILSGSTALVQKRTTGDLNYGALGAISFPVAAGAYALDLLVTDARGNVMPAGTTVGISVSGNSGVGIGGSSSYTVPCTATPLVNISTTVPATAGQAGSQVFPFTLTTTPGTSGSGVLIITVTSTKGTSTVYQLPLTTT